MKKRYDMVRDVIGRLNEQRVRAHPKRVDRGAGGKEVIRRLTEVGLAARARPKDIMAPGSPPDVPKELIDWDKRINRGRFRPQNWEPSLGARLGLAPLCRIIDCSGYATN